MLTVLWVSVVGLSLIPALVGCVGDRQRERVLPLLVLIAAGNVFAMATAFNGVTNAWLFQVIPPVQAALWCWAMWPLPMLWRHHRVWGIGLLIVGLAMLLSWVLVPWDTPATMLYRVANGVAGLIAVEAALAPLRRQRDVWIAAGGVVYFAIPLLLHVAVPGEVTRYAVIAGAECCASLLWTVGLVSRRAPALVEA